MVRLLARSDPGRGLSARQRVQVAIFAFPVLLLAAAALYGIEGGIYVLRSERVEGTVVQRYDWPGQTIFDSGEINYEPIFTYRLNGEEHRASVGSPHSSFRFDIGDTAVIRAIPGSRGNVRLDTWQGLWFVPAMLGLFGLAALVVAFVLWRVIARIFFRKEAS